MKPLPMFPQELLDQGVSQCDFIIITGDAYVDHPSFGAAIIGRVLESEGYSVGIIAQPTWDNGDDITRLGLPKLAFLVTSGNMDSMVAHFSSTKRRRREDAYTPGGVMGKRPDRAILVYSALVRQYAPGVPLIIGGIEASLRRFGHYDYWSNKVRRSLLLDSRADILIYGMGEQAVRVVAHHLSKKKPVESIQNVPGTVIKCKEPPKSMVELPSYKEISDKKTGKSAYAKSYSIQEKHTAPGKNPLGEFYDHWWIVQNPPMPPLSTREMDQVYGLPFTRKPHPSYHEEIPATKEVSCSITSSRGCFGGCSFCALRFHQGRTISSRSKGSIIAEAKQIIQDSTFKGYIHDIGGPTANFYKGPCDNPCTERECLFPKPCKNLQDSQTEYFDILRAVRKIPRIKKVFVRSGIRYDYLLHHKREDLIKELCQHHVSGQLKIAPEHIADNPTKAMRKPGVQVYNNFKCVFQKANEELHLKQYVIPYLISGHPGTTLEDALELALYLKKDGFIPDQVQDFYPTPGTRSTTMYYTGLVPETLQPIHIPDEHEKHLQRGLIHFHKPENHKTVIRALREIGRDDLISQLRPYGKSTTAGGGSFKKGSSRNKNSHTASERRPRSKNGTKNQHPKRGSTGTGSVKQYGSKGNRKNPLKKKS